MSRSSRQNAATRREQLRLEQERVAREKRVRTIVTIAVIGVVAVAAIGLIAAVVLRSGPQNSTGPSAVPTGGAVDGSTLVIGKADAPVTVDIYQDYMCPYCGQFERANRADLQTMVDDGTARLRLHPLNFLDKQSAGTEYSTRAANAAVVVAQHEPDRLLAFNAALFDQQPAEGSKGLTDEQIADLAEGAGVTSATVALFTTSDYATYLDDLTEAAFTDGGISGTPTVKIDEQVFAGDLYTAGPLKAAVETAAQGK